MGILETTGIASIMPFMAVIAAPGSIHQNKVLSFAYTYFNFQGTNDFIFFVGMGVLIILVINNSFAAFTTWRLLRFVYLSGHQLSTRLFEKYLGHPYSFFLHNNSADLSKNIITEVHRIVVGIMTPFMQMITRSIIAVCILTLLIAMDPLLAALIILVCGGSYFIVFLISKKKLSLNGTISISAQGQRFKIISEGFGGIKALKIHGREIDYIKRYEEPSLSFATCESTNQIISILPKYALEAIIFGGMLLTTLYLIEIKHNTAQLLPTLALYAFAGYRLMPGFNQIFQGLTQIRYHSAALNLIYDHINTNLSNKDSVHIHNNDIISQLKIHFYDSLELKNIIFSYSKDGPQVIDKLNLQIKANTTIAFVGKTGSGKTTLIDIILGLLQPDSGKILMDGTILDHQTMRFWQKNIGYVPQQIYIGDDTVTRNIAFGIADEEINFERVKNAARLADIDRFVTTELANGYDTILGERGVRLSGGQRQRIGIARALYDDPKVLILDEATSSLDGLTETVIMEAIHTLAHKKTILLIAHRLTTVTECDTIHVLDGGKIIASGNYQELLVNCEHFRHMTKQKTH
nr:ABC transporter ATP-binding protein [uncultured Desulfobulbus sp.]